MIKKRTFSWLKFSLPQTFPPKLVLLDFGDMDSMPEAITEILECYGCLDILILNSSMKLKAPVQTISLVMDKLIMDHNYFGPATLAKGTTGSSFRLGGRETVSDSDCKCCCGSSLQVFCPPWSPGEPATCCWSTASRGNSRCLSAPHVSEKGTTSSLHFWFHPENWLSSCWKGAKSKSKIQFARFKNEEKKMLPLLQTLPPNTLCRLSSTVWEPRWMNTAFLSAPSVTPTSAPRCPNTQGRHLPDHSGPVSTTISLQRI